MTAWELPACAPCGGTGYVDRAAYDRGLRCVRCGGFGRQVCETCGAPNLCRVASVCAATIPAPKVERK